MPYNGELKELYKDLEKRIELGEVDKNTWRKSIEDKLESYQNTDKEHRSYMHEKMHEMLNNIVILSAKMDLMPCKEHIKDFDWLKRNATATWVVIGGIVSFIVVVHLGG